MRGSLSRKGDKIKFVDVRFKKWQIVGFRESSGWQWVPQMRHSNLTIIANNDVLQDWLSLESHKIHDESVNVPNQTKSNYTNADTKQQSFCYPLWCHKVGTIFQHKLLSWSSFGWLFCTMYFKIKRTKYMHFIWHHEIQLECGKRIAFCYQY